MSGHPLSSLRRSAGETLIETVLAVMILGISVAAVSGAVMMATGAAAMNSQTTESDMILRSWAEELAVAPYTPLCRTPTQVEVAPGNGWSGGSGTWTRTVDNIPYTATVSEVRYWKSGSNQFGATCDTPDSGVQRLTLEVSAPSLGLPGTTKSLQVTVRNPCAEVGDPGCSA